MNQCQNIFSKVAISTFVLIASLSISFAQANFSYQKQLTIGAAQVSGATDLTNFPILINVTDLDLRTQVNGGGVRSDDGYDIAVYDSLGTLLDLQIEKYDGTTGEYIAWVKVPILRATNTTYLTLYYGNSSSIANPSSTAVWDSGYIKVYHMNNDPSGTAPQETDVTSNSNDATSGGTMTTGDLVAGQIGNTIDFDGSDDELQSSDIAAIDNVKALTLSAWVKIDDINDDHVIFSKGNLGGGFPFSLWRDDVAFNSGRTNTISINVSTGSNDARIEGANGALNDTDWHYVVATFEGDDATGLKLYIDGVEDANSPLSTALVDSIQNNGSPVRIGAAANGSNFDGNIDEVRISSIARSADWIATEFNNQEAPATFITLGAEEPARLASPGGISANLGAWYKAGGLVSISGSTLTQWDNEASDSASLVTVGGDPSLVENGVNFNPYVEFDGDDYIHGPSTGVNFTSDDENTFIGVFNYSSGAVIAKWEQNTSNRVAFEGSGTKLRHDRPTSASGFSSVSDVDNQWILAAVTSSSTVDSMVLNGIIDQSDASGTNTSSAAGNFQLAANTTGAFPADVDISEIISYTDRLNDSLLNQVQSYLAIKYGITLGSTASTSDYKNSSGETIWTGSATYQNDIAGIGRDDSSGLDQRKSQSINANTLITMALVDNSGSFDSPNQATANNSFMIWGHDAGALAVQNTETPAGVYERISREWTISETGTIGSVSLTIDTTGLDLSERALDQFKLLVDQTDSDFSSGVTLYDADSISGGELYFSNIDFTDGDFFTLSTTPSAPGGVTTNLSSWFKADVGVFADAGTTAATSGNDVQQWNDQKNGYNATQTDASAQPAYVDEAINFNPAIQFDESNVEYLSLNSFASDIITKNNSIYSVATPTGADSDFLLYASDLVQDGNGNGAIDIYELQLDLRSDTRFQMRIQDGSQAGTTVGINSDDLGYRTTWVLTANYLAGGSSNVSQNAISPNTNTAPADNRSVSRLHIGGHTNPGVNTARFFDGNIGELITYSSVLNSTDQLKVQSYLAMKYGVTLGNTSNTINYVNSSGTTIWTGSATYQNNIAAIGRDDRADLDQRKSLSEEDDGVVTMALTDNSGSFASPNEATVDQSFLLWGHDDGSFDVQTSEVPSVIYERIGREWSVSEKGTIGEVTLAIDTTQLDFSERPFQAFRLMIDTDNDFSSGVTIYQPDSISGGQLYFSGIDFSDGDFFSLAVAAKGPGGVTTGLGTWYKADGDVSVSGTTLTSWGNETSGEANLVNVGNDPSLVSEGINFNPYVEFDGDDYIHGPSLGSNFTSANENTFMGMFNFHSGAVIAKWEENVSNRVAFEGSGTKLRHDRPTSASGFFSVSDVQDLWTLATVASSASSIDSMILNGTVDAGDATGVNDPTASGNFQLGANSSGTFPAEVDISEIISFTERLNDSLLNQVESYLAIKYGVTLGNTTIPNNYTNSSGETIWVGSATYQNNVAGIGRDDLSSLDQRKSRSIRDAAMITMALVDNSGTFAAPNTPTADQSFLIWGNDDGTLTEQVTEVPSGIYKRIGREWTVTENGTIGNTVVAVDTSFLDLPNTVAKSFRLLIDTDSDFANGVTTYSPDSISSGSLYFNNIDFNDGDFFTLATTPTAPGGIVFDIGAWYKADNNVDTAGGVLTAWNNSFVGSTDITNIGNDPVLIENSVNGNSYVEFDGDDYIFEPVDGSNFVGVNSSTAIMALNYRSGAVISKWEDDVNNRLAFEGSANKLRHDKPTSASSFSSVADINDRWIIASATSAANDSTIINGVFDNSQLSGANDPTQLGNISFAANPDGAFPAEMDLAEHIFYVNRLSDENLQKVESYMAIKYGITLGSIEDTVDYLASDGDTIWTGDTTYQNEIAGVGRDDASELMQLSSTSILGSEVKMKVASIATDKEFVVWGANDSSIVASTTSKIPTGIDVRLKKIWRVQKSGTITIDSLIIDLSSVPNNKDEANLELLIDTDGDFSNATRYTGGRALIGDTILVFTNVNFTNDGINFFTIGSNDLTSTPLPVDFVNVKASLNEEEKVLVEWSTALQLNNDYFIIEHSSDLLSWSSIDKVNGAGNSNELLQYSIIHSEPLKGNNYYRIAQVDFDGTVSYSEVLVVNYSPLVDWELYPNPTDGIVTIRFTKAVESSSFVLSNILGVYLDVPVEQLDEQTFEVNLSDLAPGTYLLTISQGQQTTRKTLIKK